MGDSVVQSITQIDFPSSPKNSAPLGIRHTGVHLMRDYNVVIIIIFFVFLGGV